MKKLFIVFLVGISCIHLYGCASHKVRSVHVVLPSEYEGTYPGVRYDSDNIKDGFANRNPVQVILSVLDLPFSLLWDLIHFPVDLKKTESMEGSI